MIKHKNNITETIHKFICEQFPTDESPNDDTRLFEDGYVDSVGLLSIIYFIEDSFNVKISDEDVVGDNFESIITITAFIERKLP